ncbi:hypothetical protein STANM309S_00600 [Streptomyces tanashiensis]
MASMQRSRCVLMNGAACPSRAMTSSTTKTLPEPPAIGAFRRIFAASPVGQLCRTCTRR